MEYVVSDFCHLVVLTIIQIAICCQWKPHNRGNLGVTESHPSGLKGGLDNCVISYVAMGEVSWHNG
jgi:hypothetical protein